MRDTGALNILAFLFAQAPLKTLNERLHQPPGRIRVISRRLQKFPVERKLPDVELEIPVVVKLDFVPLREPGLAPDKEELGIHRFGDSDMADFQIDAGAGIP